MTEPSADRPLSPTIVREAISWNLRLEPAQGSERDNMAAEIERWCQRHPDHRLAWQRVGLLRGEFRDLSCSLSDPHTSVPVVRRACVELGQRKALKLLVAACAVGGTGSWLAAARSPWGATHTTRTGERQRFTLADGTQVTLNTASALDIDFDEHQRLLILRAGEIRVESGADAASPHRRPLRVQCRFGLCEALGTRFTLREDHHASQLSVSEGRVAVSQHGTLARVVASGDVVRCDAQGVQSIRPAVDPEAWSEGMLVVTDIRLDAFVAELARYRRGFVTCDASVAALRLSGVFQLDPPRQALQHLTRTLPVSIVSRTDWWIRVQPAAATPSASV